MGHRDAFRWHAGLAATISAVGLVVATLAPREVEVRQAAVLGVTLAALSGALALVLKRRVAHQSVPVALKVVGVIFGLRAVGVVLGLMWVVTQGLGTVAFVAGFFGTYFALQWIEVSYVLAASRDAAGGDE